MFGLTKKTPQNQIENKSTAPDQAQVVDFNIDEAPIHTMQDDLKNLKNPNASHDIIMDVREDVGKITTNQPSLSQKQSNSPFLNLANRNPLNGIIASDEKPQSAHTIESVSEKEATTEKASDMPFAQTQKNFGTNAPANISNFKTTPSMTRDSIVFHYNWRMIFFSTLALFLIIILSWVGFHYSQDRAYNPFKKPSQPIVVEPIRSEEPKEPIKEPPPKPILSYSQDNPNYLRLEDPILDEEKIKTVLKQYIDKVSKEAYVAPVEFVLTDAQNKAIGFKSFSSLLGLKFSPALLALLGENFNLFIYNDITAPKIGIAIESKDDINLTKVILAEEKKLADEISPFFFTKEYKTEKDFASSEYNAVKVRYQNVISPDTLSVDYAVYKNKLLIGTTKLTLRSIIDKLNGVKKESVPEMTKQTEANSPANEDAPNNAGN